MPKSVLLFLLLLCFFSCNRPHDTFSIRGYIENATEGDTIGIASFTGDTVLVDVAHCTVKGKRFSLQGIVEHPTPLYLRYKVQDGYRHCMLFMEKGDIGIFIDTAGCRITGTPLNDLRNSIEDSITSYLAKLSEIEKLYYTTELNAGQLACLSACGLNLQERLVAYLHTAVKENIHNPLGLHLLVAYSPLFTMQELETLMEQIPDSIIVGGNIPFHTTLTAILEERKNTQME